MGTLSCSSFHKKVFLNRSGHLGIEMPLAVVVQRKQVVFFGHVAPAEEDRHDDWWKMALWKGKSEKQKVKSYLMESEEWKVTLWKQPSPSQTSPRAPPTSPCLTPRWCQRGKPDCNYDQALLGMWVELICVLSTLHFNSLFYFNISILSFISTHQFLYFNIFILYFILTFQFCTLLWHINDSLLFFKI